jgi:hypothetical protein
VADDPVEDLVAQKVAIVRVNRRRIPEQLQLSGATGFSTNIERGSQWNYTKNKGDEPERRGSIILNHSHNYVIRRHNKLHTSSNAFTHTND